jgi:Ca2+-binding EF-hand superfamily protein
MLSLLPKRLDFPAFLTRITSQTSLLSSRDQLVEAFITFDEKDNGFVDYAELKRDLSQSGPQRLTEKQIDEVLSGFVEKVGKNKGEICYHKLLDAMTGDQNQARTRV